MTQSEPPRSTQSQPSIRSFFTPRTQTSLHSPPATSQISASQSGNVPISPPKLAPTKSIPPPPPPPPSSITVSPPVSITSPPPSSSLPTSHPQVVIYSVQKQHISSLRQINALLLPISYPDSFYNTIISPQTQPNFSRLLLWTDKATTSNPSPSPKVIGGIVARLEVTPDTQVCNIYLQSLALLSPYRGLGLAKDLLDQVVQQVVSVQSANNYLKIESLYAHVWTDNEEGKHWYESRGFTQEGQVIKGYYQRLQPDSAIVLRRRLAVGDYLSKSSNGQTSTPILAEPEPLAKLRPNILQSERRPVSYQKKGPEREWNDLPDEILALPTASSRNSSRVPSRVPSRNEDLIEGHDTASSLNGHAGADELFRSSAPAMKGKKKRVYPAAAFGA